MLENVELLGNVPYETNQKNFTIKRVSMLPDLRSEYVNFNTTSFTLEYTHKTRIRFLLINCGTVVTPNKGQPIFGKMGSNKGNSQFPLFVIFDKWCEIRDFSVEIRQK